MRRLTLAIAVVTVAWLAFCGLGWSLAEHQHWMACYGAGDTCGRGIGKRDWWLLAGLFVPLALWSWWLITWARQPERAKPARPSTTTAVVPREQ